MGVNAHGKAFNISLVTASRTFVCMTPEFFSRLLLISVCRWARIRWKCFSILVLRFSQA